MNREHKKMVTWIDCQHEPNRIPKPNTTILMVVDYEVCIGFYDVECGFQKQPIECRFSNHFNSKGVTPTFWAYLPRHPFGGVTLHPYIQTLNLNAKRKGIQKN